MAITTFDQLVDAFANNASRVVLDKASLANQTAGETFTARFNNASPGAMFTLA